MKDEKEQLAPNIIKMARWSNHVVQWLVSEILIAKESLKQRVTLYEKVVMIAYHLDKMNNFNGVKEVLGALESSPIFRLKKTKESLSSKTAKTLDALKRITASEYNYKLLRARVKGVIL